MKRARKSFNVYVFGNELVDEDATPIRIVSKLRKELKNVNFVQIDPTEIFPEEKHLLIIDTVLNISEIKLIKNIDQIKIEKKCSVHDYDLAFQLKLMKKLGRINDFTIIGIPPKKDEEECVKEIKKIISNLL